MTKHDAKAELFKGKKLTHRFFMSHEYIQIRCGNLIDEDELVLPWKIFWENRTEKDWQTGWKLFKH